MEFFGSAEWEKSTLGTQFEFGSDSQLGVGNVRAEIPGTHSSLDYSMVKTSLSYMAKNPGHQNIPEFHVYSPISTLPTPYPAEIPCKQINADN